MSSRDFQALAEKIQQLERRCDTNDALIMTLENDNRKLKEKNKALQTKTDTLEALEGLKEASVFSARLSTDNDLSQSQPNFHVINKNIKIYKASTYFDATTCRLTAPVNGHYYLDMGMRQDGKPGSLETMLMIGADGDSNHAYIGRTNGRNSSCHKTMVVTLKKGDTVHGVVRRISGKAGILWCAFHGYLISATSYDYLHVQLEDRKTPSAPPTNR